MSFGQCFNIPGRAIYISTPITTGRAFVDMHQENLASNRTGSTNRPNHVDSIVGSNIARATTTVETVRGVFPGRVIVDPTELVDIPTWTQKDYHVFWVKVLQQHADTVVFVDDWQYSTGCTIEYVAALERNLIALTQSLKRLEVEEAGILLRHAAAELRVVGLDTGPTEVALRRVQEVLERRPALPVT